MRIIFVPGVDEMNPPSTLPRPYKHEMTVAEYRRMMASLKSFEKKPEFLKLQCYHLSEKSTTYGKRLGVFLLGVWPGAFGGEDTRGSTADEWADACWGVHALLTDWLKGIEPYKEEWSGERGFQFRFETYIRFSELA